MFDAKSILDALVRGGTQSAAPGQPGAMGGLEDLLRQLTSGGQPAATTDARSVTPPARVPSSPRQPQNEDAEMTAPRDQPSNPASPGAGGGLEDMIRNVLGGQGGSITDMLGKLKQQAGQPGGLADILGQVLGQATSGVREGAGRIDEATGASRHARDALGQATGRSPEELLAQLKEMMAKNQLGTGAAIGGLGAVLLGTGAGRSLAGSAAKLGSLALIGGLAYKAYQNYQQGQPVLPGVGGTTAKPGPATGQPPVQAAPEGSGFEAGAATNAHATVLIRAMIAAAAADGRIDDTEQAKILGALKQGGLDAAAQQFLAQEIKKPATIDEIADAVQSEEEGVQVYTAARITVNPDAQAEHAFLEALADALGIDDELAKHIDATARGAGA
jgi:uncharacterized membrane protein YebE (DUF533 family)